LQRRIEFEERDFFQQPFSRAEIVQLLRGSTASEMFNFRSPAFKKLGLEQDKLSDGELIELMLKEPRLIRRPVVRIDDRVYFGADAGKLRGVLG